MPSKLESLAVLVEPCTQVALCLNGPLYKAPALAYCRDCRLAVLGGGTGTCWRAADKKTRHPVLEQEKKEAAVRRRNEREAKRAGVDKKKQGVLKDARRSEKKSLQQMVKATVNSGRLRKDGDYTLNQRITLDNKQTPDEHPKVKLTELDKVRADSKRAGTMLGGLILKNKHGRGVVVFDLSDIAQVVDLFGH